MNKTFKKVFSVCCAVVTTLTATLFHSANLKAEGQTQKIVFVGPSETGKTNLVLRIHNNSYTSDYTDTTGAAFISAGQIKLWDTGGNSIFLDNMDTYLRGAHLCVLSISNTNQKTEDFLKVIAANNVPKVVLCITKTDEVEPDNDAISELLVKITQQLPQGVNVFDKVLYTSAQNNTFKFCTPDTYNASNEYQIYDTVKQKQVLAGTLYKLCGDKAEDSQAENYDEKTSYEASIEYDSFTGKPNTSNGKKYALGLGIPAGLLPLIIGIGYYEYDRHFRKQEKTKTETKSEQTPKANRKISS